MRGARLVQLTKGLSNSEDALRGLSNFSSQSHIVATVVDIVGAFVKNPKLLRTKFMNIMMVGAAGTGLVALWKGGLDRKGLVDSFLSTAASTGMIFFMIVIGALTRLTESGLSMVEWRPVTGWLPPLSDVAWQAELQKYLASPQGRMVNHTFTVPEFREIFWLEYIHRLWGRLIGVVFALPLAWFWWRGALSGTARRTRAR